MSRSYSEFVQQIDFEFIRPDTKRGRDGRFTVTREGGSRVTLLELPGAPFDALNTRLPEDGPELHRALRPLLEIPRMGTFAMGAMMNRGVKRLRPSEAYVNVGVWNGFSFFSGLRDNPDKLCIGIDNFSQFLGPQEAFMARLEEHRAPMHRFFDMDYQEYFATQHEAPIGLYFYDGNHDYEHQLRGLQVAEPFFSDDCVVLVDDTNWGRPHQATLDFIAQSEREYEILVDVRTPEVSHPTFWNGVMVFQAVAPGQSAAGSSEDSRSPATNGENPAEPNPIDYDGRSTLVSLVVCNMGDDAEALEATIEAALAQTWPSIEVLVVDESAGGVVQDTIGRYADRVESIAPKPAQSAPRTGLEASNGSFVALFDSGARFDETAVETGLALPHLSRFQQGAVQQSRKQRIGSALAAAQGILEVVPADASFVLAARKLSTPQIVDARSLPLFDATTQMETLSPEGAIERIEELRGQGASYLAFMRETFSWLADRPVLEEHLSKTCRSVLDNEHVRVLELGPAGS